LTINLIEKPFSIEVVLENQLLGHAARDDVVYISFA
jgi:hypothetical protein